MSASDVERTRTFEAGGHRWTVTEANYPTASDSVGGCLMFRCDAIIRRVRKFPPDWYQRSDAVLFEVSLSI